MLIGFTGKRGVGKSEAAKILAARGFLPAHAFAGGKAAAEAFFLHIGATREEARDMVYGNLRDVPSALLPDRATPRFFLEKLGNWWGTQLGPDWSLGRELARIKRDAPFASVVAESIVYEADVFRHAGGKIVRVIRPDHVGPVGMMTDIAEARIAADAVIVNDGSLAELEIKVLALV